MIQGAYHLHEDKTLLLSLKQCDQQAFDVIYHRQARNLFIKAATPAHQ
jgi:hypothetical protein